MMSPEEKYGPMRPGEEEALGALLREVGPKAEAPAEVREQVRNAVEAEWRAAIAKQRTPKRGVTWRRPALALAASLTVISLLTWFLRPELFQPERASITLERSVGPVQLSSPAGWLPVSARRTLTIGEVLVTGPGGRAQLAWLNGTTLRLDVDTRIAIAAEERIVLERGAVYLDTGVRIPAGRSLWIDSKFGTTRHVGTQYEVRMMVQEMVITVREGRVEFTGSTGTVKAMAGEQLEIAPTGAVERRSVGRRDPQWAWTETVSPTFAIEQRRLPEFLVWVARETGRDLRFASEAVKADATSIVLRGSVADLDPEAAIAAVMSTTPLGFTVDEGQITVSSDVTETGERQR